MRTSFFQGKGKTTLVFLLCFLVFFLVFSVQLSAQTAGELRDKIEESNNEISRLEEEIKQYERELAGLAEEKKTLNSAIRELDITRRKLGTDIKVTEEKIYGTNLEIQRLSGQIGDKNVEIRRNLDGLSESIRMIDEFDSQSMVELLLGSDRIGDIWQDVESLGMFQEKARDEIRMLRSARKELKVDRDETEKAKRKLLALKGELSDRKKIVDDNKREKDRLLNITKNKESNYEKLIEEKERKKNEFEAALAEYEAQLKYILDPSKLPGPGVLSWPLDDIVITQLFGVTRDSKRLYASGSHSGVDLRASVGTKVYAMADGIVIGSGDTDKTCRNASWGKWITIKYDNGLASTYGHLSLLKASSGQRVSRGQTVGYSGNTGYSTAPHLHVTVYAPDAVQIQEKPSRACPGAIYTMPLAAHNAYLDLLAYTPKPSPDMFKYPSDANKYTSALLKLLTLSSSATAFNI